MYYNNISENELGFDAFIAPDDFMHDDPTQYGGDHPVDIYEIFKREYTLNSHARYIYYYSPGNYPLTLTPTATEYYRYGYTNALNQEVVVNVPLNGSPVTIWGNGITTPVNTSGGDESGYTKRWVIVYRVSTAKFTVTAPSRAIWAYLGDKVHQIDAPNLSYMKYVHFANLNSIKSDLYYFQNAIESAQLIGTLTFPETILQIGGGSFNHCPLITKINCPETKDIGLYIIVQAYQIWDHSKIVEFNIGASVGINDEAGRNSFVVLSRISVSQQNTAYASFNNCDIIYNKALTAIVWIAPKTVRGLYIPDELPQSEIGTTGTGISTKLSTNVMQGYPLHIGSLITELTNLYLSNKSFTAITVGAGNTAFTVENNILFNADKTTLVKAGTASQGSVIIPTTVTSVGANAFLRYSHTGSISLIFSGTGQFNTANYSDFAFATFTGQSLSDIITNERLVPGAAGNPKYFYINQVSLDALNAYNSNAVSIAAGQYINITTFPQGAVLHLDASNVASYPGSGTTWYDLSGNGNNGTLTPTAGGPTYSSGVMVFDGINDFALLPSINASTAITISFWIKSPSFSVDKYLLSKWKTGAETDNSYIVAMDGVGTRNCVGFAVWQTDNAYKVITMTDKPLSANTWYHFVGVAGSGGLRGYINNVVSIVENNTFNNTIKQTTRNLVVGKLRTEDNYGVANMSINDILIYQRALTSSEVSLIFDTQRTKYGI